MVTTKWAVPGPNAGQDLAADDGGSPADHAGHAQLLEQNRGEDVVLKRGADAHDGHVDLVNPLSLEGILARAVQADGQGDLVANLLDQVTILIHSDDFGPALGQQHGQP